MPKVLSTLNDGLRDNTHSGLREDLTWIAIKIDSIVPNKHNAACVDNGYDVVALWSIAATCSLTMHLPDVRVARCGTFSY